MGNDRNNRSARQKRINELRFMIDNRDKPEPPKLSLSDRFWEWFAQSLVWLFKFGLWFLFLLVVAKFLIWVFGG